MCLIQATAGAQQILYTEQVNEGPFLLFLFFLPTLG